ncbi:MAG TPA: hypothetical protein VNN55_09070 [bacterium]|nr:hypothetical protein [bacterium]
MPKTQKPEPGFDLTAIEDEGQFRVELKEKIVVGDLALYPGWDVILRGDLVKRFAESIAHAEPV